MALKSFALAASLLWWAGEISQAQTHDPWTYSIWEVIENTPYVIWNIIAWIHVGFIQPGCYANTTHHNTIIHCSTQDKIWDFMNMNHLWSKEAIPSLLKIQWESVMRVLRMIQHDSDRIWGILKIIPPYDFNVYPSKIRICFEINNPSKTDTLAWVFVDTNSDGRYDALLTGTCQKIKENWEAQISNLSLVYPGYSITLPDTIYDCLRYKNYFMCRDGVVFPLAASSDDTLKDVVQIEYPWGTHSTELRIDLSTTYVVHEIDG